ncbi:hypothetical protein Ddye_007738 [Dipteronia dyeriana]|uniref:Reverse transcriptase n=1 Tax=Dipteronia dyeriana TaxID=168575 RepID=A0AAD9XL22_9ROSI|nr:hypothetical protein Ddye_007738 [Dipteronia dyeriana]
MFGAWLRAPSPDKRGFDQEGLLLEEGTVESYLQLPSDVRYDKEDILVGLAKNLAIVALGKMSYRVEEVHGKLVINSEGCSGSLCLFWSASVDVSLLLYSRYHIDVQVEFQCGVLWHFTGFYGHLEASQRHHAWTLLRRLKGMTDLPWVCAGGFNKILDVFEKLGRQPKHYVLLENFRSALDDCELQDMGFSELTFTWCNKRNESKKAFMDKKFTRDEIRVAVFNMFPTKALGPDGLSTLFYQKFWPIVGDRVTQMCLGVLNEGHNLDGVDDTLIMLIPKMIACCLRGPASGQDYGSIKKVLDTYTTASGQLVNFRKSALCVRSKGLVDDLHSLCACFWQDSDEEQKNASVKVSTLNLPTGKWNEALIHQSFLAEDVSLILRIPCSSALCPDSLMWHSDKLGSFSVTILVANFFSGLVLLV